MAIKPNPTDVVTAIASADEVIDKQTGGPGEMVKAVRKELYGTIAAVDAAIRKQKSP